MRVHYNNPKIKFYIGDVRNESSLRDAMIGVYYVFHAAWGALCGKGNHLE